MVDTRSHQGANWGEQRCGALISLGAVRVSRAIYVLCQLFDTHAQANIDDCHGRRTHRSGSERRDKAVISALKWLICGGH
jgi:hypothetical protein